MESEKSGCLGAFFSLFKWDRDPRRTANQIWTETMSAPPRDR